MRNPGELMRTAIAIFLLALCGCVSQKPAAKHFSAPMPRAEVSAPVPSTQFLAPALKPITLAWDDPNSAPDLARLTELWSTTNLNQSFKRKMLVSAGVNQVSLMPTNRMELFICRFTNTQTHAVSGWNVK